MFLLEHETEWKKLTRVEKVAAHLAKLLLILSPTSARLDASSPHESQELGNLRQKLMSQMWLLRGKGGRKGSSISLSAAHRNLQRKKKAKQTNKQTRRTMVEKVGDGGKR